MGMKTTQSRAQCDGYREQTQLKSWIWHIKGCCRSSDINYQHLKAEWTVLTCQIGLMIHDGSYSAICSWTCSTGHLPGAKSGRACSTKKKLMAKKEKMVSISPMAALPWAPLAPFSPQSTGTATRTSRRGDGRRVAAAGKWWGSRSSKVLGSVALAAGLMGLQKSVSICMSDLKSKWLRKIAYSWL